MIAWLYTGSISFYAIRSNVHGFRDDTYDPRPEDYFEWHTGIPKASCKSTIRLAEKVKSGQLYSCAITVHLRTD